MSREDELIDWLRRRQPGSGLDRPGDDAAVLAQGSAALALTVDQQIAEVHVPADLDAAVWARRLLAVNLSDLAAMGAEPVAALLTLAVPPEFPHRRFLGAAVEACRAVGIHLAGGDLARSAQAVTGMTLVGRRPRGGRWLTRSAARPGDRLWLGAQVGISALGQRLVGRGARLRGNRVELPALADSASGVLRAARDAVRRHLAPTPQLELGQWLGRRRAAAIDISDGLARDLHRLCRASEVGVVLELAALQPSAELGQLARDEGEDFLALALGGGEDYALLFTLGPRTRPPSRFGAVAIGEVTASRRIQVRRDGRLAPLEPQGWDHLA